MVSLSNGIQVESEQQLEELMVDMDEESKIGLRALYQEEQNKLGGH